MSTKGTTVKRILKEASELSASPSPDFTAAPLETDLFEWHFTLRGPPAPSPFSGGVYHGRIRLPPSYPLRPPSFRFLTPSGRFEVNREICLSISGFHEETWQPAWGIRTALVAIRSFMDSEAAGAVGAMNAADEVRRRLAGESGAWRCRECARSNDEIMVEQEGLCRENGGGSGGKRPDTVPEELRLGYREELEGGNGVVSGAAKEGDAVPEAEARNEDAVAAESARPIRAPVAVPPRMPFKRHQATAQDSATSTPSGATPAPTRTSPPRRQTADTGILDKAIVATAAALLFMIIRLMFF